jgi:hypothetical protein
VKPGEERTRGRYRTPMHVPGWSAAALTLMAAGLIPGVRAAAPAAASPVPTAQAEFGGQCPEALAEGQHVMTDCSVTWTDKDGKLFCFSTQAAKTSFLSNPTEKLARAREFMAASNVESTETAMQSFTSSDAEALVSAG